MLKPVTNVDDAWLLWQAGLLVDAEGNSWYPAARANRDCDVRGLFDVAVNNHLNGTKKTWDTYLYVWEPYVYVEDEE